MTTNTAGRPPNRRSQAAEEENRVQPNFYNQHTTREKIHENTRQSPHENTLGFLCVQDSGTPTHRPTSATMVYGLAPRGSLNSFTRSDSYACPRGVTLLNHCHAAQHTQGQPKRGTQNHKGRAGWVGEFM